MNALEHEGRFKMESNKFHRAMMISKHAENPVMMT